MALVTLLPMDSVFSTCMPSAHEAIFTSEEEFNFRSHKLGVFGCKRDSPNRINVFKSAASLVVEKVSGLLGIRNSQKFTQIQ